jgi:cytochrome c oxidase subunit 3
VTGRRVVGDLSTLQPYGTGARTLWFWGALGFMLIEGMGFVLAIATYLYLMSNAVQWPLDSRPPDLIWGTLMTGLTLASLIPNAWLAKRASDRRLKAVQIGTALMTLIGLATLVVRAFEFSRLNTRWDHDAYGSIVWALIVLHSTHLVTDVIDTLGLSVVLFTHPVDPERFSDVDDNALYWTFVVLAWLPIYFVIYWLPRLAA